MKRRRARRRSRRASLSVVALLVSLGVIAAAVVLIVRGDTTPSAESAARRPPHDAGVLAASPSPSPGAVTATTAPATEQPSAPATGAPVLASPEPSPSTSAPAQPPHGAAQLAIIIDDCGQWPQTERGFIALPVALTLSVLPHMRYGAAIARDARAAGKGVMLHLPMEPLSGIEPGPGHITVAMDDAAIAGQVRADLDDVPLATGVNNHEGSRATADDRVMRAVAAVLAERHVFFIDSRTNSATVAERDTLAAGVPSAGRDVFLDDVDEVGAVEAQLRAAAALARRHGSAIAIGHPRTQTLLAVRTLLPELAQEGVTLVLARDLVRTRD
jgi:hypothetical protein